MTRAQTQAIDTLRKRFGYLETTSVDDEVARVECYEGTLDLKRAVVAFIAPDGEVVEFRDQA